MNLNLIAVALVASLVGVGVGRATSPRPFTAEETSYCRQALAAARAEARLQGVVQEALLEALK